MTTKPAYTIDGLDIYLRARDFTDPTGPKDHRSRIIVDVTAADIAPVTVPSTRARADGPAWQLYRSTRERELRRRLAVARQLIEDRELGNLGNPGALWDYDPMAGCAMCPCTPGFVGNPLRKDGHLVDVFVCTHTETAAELAEALDSSGPLPLGAPFGELPDARLDSRDADLRDWPAAELNVGGYVGTLKDMGTDEARVRIVRPDGTELAPLAVRVRPDGDVELVINV